MKYRVVVMPTVERAIDDYIHYIAVVQREPRNAARVLTKIETALTRIEIFPHAAPLAPENEFRDYVIRMIVVVSCRILLTIDEEEKIVRVIGFRHARRLPDSGDLPSE